MNKQFGNNLEQIKCIFQTLHKIIHNITTDPYEMKFRNLKKTNAMVQKTILVNIQVLKFLKLFGFEEDE